MEGSWMMIVAKFPLGFLKGVSFSSLENTSFRQETRTFDANSPAKVSNKRASRHCHCGWWKENLPASTSNRKSREECKNGLSSWNISSFTGSGTSPYPSIWRPGQVGRVGVKAETLLLAQNKRGALDWGDVSVDELHEIIWIGQPIDLSISRSRHLYPPLLTGTFGNLFLAWTQWILITNEIKEWRSSQERRVHRSLRFDHDSTPYTSVMYTNSLVYGVAGFLNITVRRRVGEPTSKRRWGRMV